MARAGERWTGRGLDGVELTVDIASQIEAWRDRYASTVGMAKYRRAAAWATDETAKRAVLGIRQQFHKTLKRNSPWTQSAVSYARADKAALNGIENGTRSMDEVFAKVFVKPNQSAYLKYLFGMGDNVRLPGDVGLAQDKILIPWWQNITMTQGVRPRADGGVPRGFLARLNREVEGKRSKRSATSGRWGVYKGTIKLHGQPRLAYIARPPRVPVAIPDTIDQAWEGRERVITTAAGHLKQVGRRMRDIDHPRILFLAVDRATYRPTLQEPWDLECRAAAAGIGMTMARQLADNIEHARKREAGRAMAA